MTVSRGRISLRAQYLTSSVDPTQSLKGLDVSVLAQDDLCYVYQNQTLYQWFPASTAADDGASIIVPDVQPGGVGAWLKVGTVNPGAYSSGLHGGVGVLYTEPHVITGSSLAPEEIVLSNPFVTTAAAEAANQFGFTASTDRVRLTPNHGRTNPVPVLVIGTALVFGNFALQDPGMNVKMTIGSGFGAAVPAPVAVTEQLASVPNVALDYRRITTTWATFAAANQYFCLMLEGGIADAVVVDARLTITEIG